MTMLLDGKAVYRYTGEGIPSTSMYIVLSNGVMKGESRGRAPCWLIMCASGSKQTPAFGAHEKAGQIRATLKLLQS